MYNDDHPHPFWHYITEGVSIVASFVGVIVVVALSFMLYLAYQLITLIMLITARVLQFTLLVFGSTCVEWFFYGLRQPGDPSATELISQIYIIVANNVLLLVFLAWWSGQRFIHRRTRKYFSIPQSSTKKQLVVQTISLCGFCLTVIILAQIWGWAMMPYLAILYQITIVILYLALGGVGLALLIIWFRMAFISYRPGIFWQYVAETRKAIHENWDPILAKLKFRSKHTSD